MVIAVFMAGLVAGALTPGDKVQPYSSLTVDPPAPTGSSFAYTLGPALRLVDVFAGMYVALALTCVTLTRSPSV